MKKKKEDPMRKKLIEKMRLHIAKVYNEYLPFLDELANLRKKSNDIFQEMMLTLAK